MKKNVIVVILVLVACEKSKTLSFDGKEYKINNEAIELNNKALEIITRNYDSLDYGIDLLAEAIRIDSNYVLAYQNKINNESELERYDFGITTITAFVKRFPDNPSGYVFMGRYMHRKGDVRVAKEYYAKALDATLKSYERRSQTIDSTKDGLFYLLYLHGDTALANRHFELYKLKYDSMQIFKGVEMKDIIKDFY